MSHMFGCLYKTHCGTLITYEYFRHVRVSVCVSSFESVSINGSYFLCKRPENLILNVLMHNKI